MCPNEEKTSSTASSRIVSNLPSHALFFFSQRCIMQGAVRFIVLIVLFTFCICVVQLVCFT